MSGPLCPDPGGALICTEHASYLSRRGVDLAYALQLGLRCVDADTATTSLRMRLPHGGLLIPYACGYTRLRSTAAAIDRGAPKFVAQAAAEVPIYLTAHSAQQAAHIDVPIVIVEGPLKAVALECASLPMAAVGLGGVSTTLVTGSTIPRLNESWEAISLAGRTVIILFDANRSTNASVAAAEARLSLALERAGAKVLTAALPPPQGGGDQGPDDFVVHVGLQGLLDVIGRAHPADPRLLIGEGEAPHLQKLLDYPTFLHQVLARGEGVRAAVEARFAAHRMKNNLARALKEAQRLARDADVLGAVGNDERYEVERGALAWVAYSRGQRVLRTLANFDARIAVEKTWTDGRESRRLVVIEGSTDDGVPLPPWTTTLEELGVDGWWIRAWGSRATASGAVPQVVQKIRTAMQTLSKPTSVEAVGNIGWKSIHDEWVFVHGNGVVGCPSFVVELEEDVARFSSLPSEVTDLPGSIDAVMRFLDVAPMTITAPLLASVFRAPVAHLLPVDMIVHLVGPSGSMKTTLAKLLLRFFGATERAIVPWASTKNAIEHHAFAAKDSIAVIDDFAPKSDNGRDEDREKFAYIVRNVGNRTSRARMDRNLKALPAREPRGVIVSTGEDIAGIESIVARVLVIGLRADSVDRAVLTEVQARADTLSHALLAYVEWMRPQMSTLVERLPRLFQELRPTMPGAHARAPERIAHLLVAIELLAAFLGSCDGARSARWQPVLEAMKDGIVTGAGCQRELEVRADPVDVFVRLLEAAIGQRDIQLTPLRGNWPVEQPDGFFDARYIYLVRERAVAAILRLADQLHENVALRTDTILRRLVERGVLEPESSRLDARVYARGRRLRVLRFRRDKLDVELEPGPVQAAALADVVPSPTPFTPNKIEPADSEGTNGTNGTIATTAPPPWRTSGIPSAPLENGGRSMGAGPLGPVRPDNDGVGS